MEQKNIFFKQLISLPLQQRAAPKRWVLRDHQPGRRGWRSHKCLKSLATAPWCPWGWVVDFTSSGDWCSSYKFLVFSLPFTATGFIVRVIIIVIIIIIIIWLKIRSLHWYTQSHHTDNVCIYHTRQYTVQHTLCILSLLVLLAHRVHFCSSQLIYYINYLLKMRYDFQPTLDVFSPIILRWHSHWLCLPQCILQDYMPITHMSSQQCRPHDRL